MDNYCHQVYQKVCRAFGVTHFCEIPCKDHSSAVKVVIYQLLKTFYTDYNYGLGKKMFLPEFDYLANFKFMIKDYESYNVVSFKQSGLFNMTYIDQRNPKVHRSGWQAVYDALLPLSSETSTTLMDLSLDRTFLWESDTMEKIGLLPYKQEWYGFLHHTFDTDFSENNCINVINNPLFKASLPTCKAIFCLSQHLTDELQIHLPTTKIITIYHPTELNVIPFDFYKYRALEKKELVHIGGWLRNTFTFYQLDVTFEKVLLSGLYNSGIPATCSPICCNGSSCSTTCCGGSTTPTNGILCCSNEANRFQKDCIQYIEKIIQSVHVVKPLSDLAYDLFLQDKVVFLHLIDASACNTVLECIARSVPIIVNRLPALEEYLGIDYPLFYPNEYSIYQINQFISYLTIDDFRRTHNYLFALDKSKFSILEFVQRMKILTQA